VSGEIQGKVKVPVIELDAELVNNVAYFDGAVAHPVPGTGMVELILVQRHKGETSPNILIPRDVAEHLEKQLHKSVKKLNGEKVA
jgi:hypothetical protein